MLLLALSLLTAQADELPSTSSSAKSVQMGQLSVTKVDSGTTVSIDTLEVDGVKSSALSCKVDRMPLLGAMVLGPAVGAGAKAAQACLDGGTAAAARVAWTWSSTTEAVEVKAVEGQAGETCLKTALATMSAPLTGTCQVVLLIGERAAAEAAATRLAP